MNSKIFFSFFALSLAESVLSFSNGRNHHHAFLILEKRYSCISQLNMGYAIADDDEWFLMQSAQDCAKSDACSLEEAIKSYENVMRIQSGCASGVLVGSAVCENADTSAELVAILRQKIEQGSKKLSALKAGSNITYVSLALIFLSAFIAGTVPINPNVVPFTPQEWFWAARDGYLPTMIQHFFHDGGLATVDFAPETTPFSLQEWWWSIKGGYLNTMSDHFFQHGGLVTSAEYQTESTSMTQQEWYWAIRDGYLGGIIEHNFQHGGLASTDYKTDTIPITPKEIQSAIQGGYINDMISHYFHNGGL
jgi:hypothetical protein